MALGTPDVEELIRRYVDRVRDRVPVTAAYIYGSYARGRATEESDIDVGIVSPAFGHDYHADLVTLSFARPPDGALIEALPFSEEEHRTLPRGSFLREIIRHGRRVV
jgi:predicted nucleotidyltransferase